MIVVHHHNPAVRLRRATHRYRERFVRLYPGAPHSGYHARACSARAQISLAVGARSKRFSENKRAPSALFGHAPIMSDRRSIENLALVGFMGCGKSSVGRLAAKDLGFEFMDTDALVRSAQAFPFLRSSLPKAKPYSPTGARNIAELETRTGLIIATGGVAIDPENLASLKRNTWWCASGPTPKPSTSAQASKPPAAVTGRRSAEHPSDVGRAGACLQTG